MVELYWKVAIGYNPRYGASVSPTDPSADCVQFAPPSVRRWPEGAIFLRAPLFPCGTSTLMKQSAPQEIHAFVHGQPHDSAAYAKLWGVTSAVRDESDDDAHL